MKKFHKLFIASTIAGGMALSGLAGATPVNLVTNGDFSQSSYKSNNQFGTNASGGYSSQGVTGWTGNSGYNIFFVAGTASKVSANGAWGYTGKEKMWGVDSSATGGNFVALDGDSGFRGGISQMINGLTVGNEYTLTFDWGSGELQSRVGNTTEQLQVSLGSDKFLTSVVANKTGSFSGWMTQSFTFVANSTSELLNFLSIGTPNGLPPIATLANVSLTENPAFHTDNDVPEPASLSLLGLGLGAIGMMRRRRKAPDA